MKVSPRHSQLAVNLAGAMAIFIVETWREQSRGQPHWVFTFADLQAVANRAG